MANYSNTRKTKINNSNMVDDSNKIYEENKLSFQTTNMINKFKNNNKVNFKVTLFQLINSFKQIGTKSSNKNNPSLFYKANKLKSEMYLVGKDLMVSKNLILKDRIKIKSFVDNDLTANELLNNNSLNEGRILKKSLIRKFSKNKKTNLSIKNINNGNGMEIEFNYRYIFNFEYLSEKIIFEESKKWGKMLSSFVKGNTKNIFYQIISRLKVKKFLSVDFLQKNIASRIIGTTLMTIEELLGEKLDNGFFLEYLSTMPKHYQVLTKIFANDTLVEEREKGLERIRYKGSPRNTGIEKISKIKLNQRKQSLNNKNKFSISTQSFYIPTGKFKMLKWNQQIPKIIGKSAL